jgi:hypothetical protein
MSSIENATLSIKIVSPAYTTLVLAFVDSRILRPYVRYYIMWFNSIALPPYAMSITNSYTDAFTFYNTIDVAFSASSYFKPYDIPSSISSCLRSRILYTTKARRTITIPDRSGVYKSADLYFLPPFYDMPDTTSPLIIPLSYSSSYSS